MTALDTNTWQAVRAEVQRRIRTRHWKPGDPIPNEADLAEEFGCARATVNRALRDLAEAGILERKRRSGTRVALHPNRRAVLDIPVIRKDIEGRGETYDYRLIGRETGPAPVGVGLAMGLTGGGPQLHLVAVHLANRVPYVLEDRWINLAAAPRAETADFTGQSANEWLLENIPVTRSELSIAAINATPEQARVLGVAPGAAVLEIHRTTWNCDAPVTDVRLVHAPGYRLSSTVEV